jgi:hypothetical protein
MSSNANRKKNPLLSSQNVKSQQTETTRLLAAMLDGKNRSKKKVKKPSASASTAGFTSEKTAAAPTAWSRISVASASSASFQQLPNAIFGAKKGLDMIPDANNILKRKKSDATTISAKSASAKPKKKGKRESITEIVGKENNNSTYGAPACGKAKVAVNHCSSCQSSTARSEGEKTIVELKDNQASYSVSHQQNKSKSHETPENGIPDSCISKKITSCGSYRSTIKGRSAGQVHVATTSGNPYAKEGVSVQTLPEKENSLMDKPLQQSKGQNPIQADKRQLVACENSDKTDAEPMLNLGLRLAQRKKRSLSMPPPPQQQQQHQTQANGTDDLAVLRAMLSSTTRSENKPQELSLPQNNNFLLKESNPKENMASKPTRLLPPMKPLQTVKGHEDNDNDAKKVAFKSRETSSDSCSQPHKKRRSNDNFVRLNLRNSAGSCRGARNKKAKRRTSYRGNSWNKRDNNKNLDEDDDSNHQYQRPPQRETIQHAETFRAGVDPLDDYLDGVLQQTSISGKIKKSAKNPKGKPKTLSGASSQPEPPQCARHQRPCKLLTVKKTDTGNKGRKFYACGMPRGEQCDHFQWADDTIEVRHSTSYASRNSRHFLVSLLFAYFFPCRLHREHC